MSIYEEARQTICEEPIGTILKKQASITRLFPPFYDRVKAVGTSGGVSLDKEKPGIWYFKVASATTKGKEYDDVVKFADLENVIIAATKDMRNWNSAKTAVDIRKLGAAVIDKADYKIYCSCPAFQYWGPAYITTKRGSKFGKKETRPPKKRNPHEYGEVCKHMQLVMDVLPFYKSSMAGHIKRHFMKVVKKTEVEMKKEVEGAKKGAEFLKGKEKEQAKESVQEPLKYVGRKITLNQPVEYMTFTMPEGSKGEVTDGDGDMLEVKFENHDSVLEVPPSCVTVQETVNESEDEKAQHFEERTKRHIDLVQKAIHTIVTAGDPTKDGAEWKDFDENALIEHGKVHDASKFEEPERTPYIELTWNYKNGVKNDTEGIQKATLHHITTNSHHPEFHLEDKSQANVSKENRDKSDYVVDATKMPPTDIAEMVADWQAMSEELKKNTAREWFNKQKDVRWHFSPEQEALIDKLLKVFEKTNESINEAAKHYEYRPSTDKKELLFDFYMLNMLPAFPKEQVMAAIREPGVPQSWKSVYDPELQYALIENKETINRYLQQHMLEALLFAICAEFKHVFDANNSKSILKFAEDHGKEDFMREYAIYYEVKHGSKADFMKEPELVRKHINDERDYRISYEAVKSTGISDKEFVLFARDMFGSGKLIWHSMYGGKKWAEICDGWLHLESAPENELSIWIDHVYDLQHNTDTVFNKLQSYYKGGYGWIKQALTYKRYVKNLYELFDHVSPEVRDFAAAVIKDVEGTTLEAWLEKKAKEQGQTKTKTKEPAAKAAPKEGEWFDVTVGAGEYKKFKVGGTVTYKSGSKKDKIGKTATVLGPAQSEYVNISFHDDNQVWKANANNLTGMDKEADNEPVTMKPTAPKGFKIGDSVFVADTGKIYPMADTVAKKMGATKFYDGKGVKYGDTGKLMAYEPDSNIVLITLDKSGKQIVIDKDFISPASAKNAPATAAEPKISKAKLPPVQTLGGFNVGDEVHYNGDTPKIVGDSGIIKKFSQWHNNVAAVKFNKFGGIVYVALKNLEKINKAEEKTYNGITIGDKVEFIQTGHEPGAQITGTVKSFGKKPDWEDQSKDMIVANVSWDNMNGKESPVDLNAIKKVS